MAYYDNVLDKSNRVRMVLALMTNEEIYDTEIAPELLKLCKRCQEVGMPFTTQVEYECGETARTEFCPAITGEDRPSAKQLLVHYAARCNGNVDSFLMAVIRDAEKYGHSSMYLTIIGVKTKPDAI